MFWCDDAFDMSKKDCLFNNKVSCYGVWFPAVIFEILEIVYIFIALMTTNKLRGTQATNFAFLLEESSMNQAHI